MTSILGINFGPHDNAVALYGDGRLLCAAEEERFIRVKYAPYEFPERAGQFCLRFAGLQPDNIEQVAFSYQPWDSLGASVFHSIRNPRFFTAELLRRATMVAGRNLAHRLLKVPRDVCFRFVKHHDAHAASAFFLSPFEEAAIAVIDGVGEWSATTIYIGRANKLTRLYSIPFPHSLGFAYAAGTEYLGFKPVDEEWKVMGLAAFGSPDFMPTFRAMIRTHAKGSYRLDLSYFQYQRDWASNHWFSDKMIRELGTARREDAPLCDRHLAIAASLQYRLTEIIGETLAYVREATGLQNLCLAGGVAQNSSTIGAIVQSGLFQRVFVQPASGDAGTALGAAVYVAYVINRARREDPMRHTYLGPEFEDQAIEDSLISWGLSFRKVADPSFEAANLLSQGAIVGWFQGRMEFGPRALGNRSILADPRDPGMKDKINRAVKYREYFRPFAPSVLAIRASDYFECSSEAPFMTWVASVRPQKRLLVPAITHVDGSSRLQTVTKETNPRFEALLREFERRTHIPLVLNTSLNVRGDPIACTPRDAVSTFMASGLDALVLGNCILEKATNTWQAG